MIDLTGEQRAALALDRDVFLEAGAGTGKTSVLVARYCAAIEQGLTPDSILAFTFTERSAAELKRRIAEELAERGLAEAAAAMHSAWISTIHGFCRRLLSTHPIAAGIDPRFSVADASEADRLAERAFDDAIESALAGGDTERARLVGALRIPRLRAMVRAAHDELRSMGREPTLPELQTPDPLARLAELEAAARDGLAELGDGGYKAHAEKMQAAVAAHERAKTGGELPASTDIEELEFGRNVKAAQGPAGAAYLDAVEQARGALVDLETANEYGFVSETLDLFRERYAELKRRRAALDFEDLQLEAVQLLKKSSSIRDRYRERFAHVMVDEFQDTNLLQLELVELLRGADSRLFTVGDELQSIYRFRHADLRVFRGQRDRFAADPRAEVLELRGNFRSLPPVIDAINEFGEATVARFQPLTAALEDGEPAPGPPAEVLVTEKNGWKPDDSGGPELQASLDDRTPHASIAEARFLAARLRQLADEGFPRGDMVVLLAAFTHVGAYEEALERAGLNPYVVSGRGYWSQQQVDDVRRLLGCVANPLDDECVLGALTAFGGVLPDTLLLLRRFGNRDRIWRSLVRYLNGEGPREDGQPIELPDEELEKLRTFHERLEALRDAAPVLPLEGVIERAINDFDYDLAVLARPRGKRRMANLRKLMRIAHEFEVSEGRDLRGLLDHLASRAAAEQRESEAATQAEDHDGVRVMTVHAAKGLEYPLVAVADLGRDLLTGGIPPALRIDLDESGEGVLCGLQLARLGAVSVTTGAYRRLKAEAEAGESEEKRRLGYVAATRAQRKLILSGIADPSRLKKLAEGEATKDSTPIITRLLLELKAGVADAQRGSFAIRANPATPDAIEALNERRSPDGGPAQPEAEGDAPLDRPKTPPGPPVGSLSYSALEAYGRCGYRFYVERLLGLPGLGGAGSRSAAAALGSAVHELLEWSAGNGWSRPDAERLAAALTAQNLTPGGKEEERAGEMVGAWLDSPLRAELDGATLHAELPFLLGVKDPDDGQTTIVRGSIDLLAELPDGGLLVVDYKTNRLDGAAPTGLGDDYSLQRAIYALAAAQHGEPPIATAYSFLEAAGEPLRHEFGMAELDQARADLQQRVARIRRGEFKVTGRPRAALCADCPARERLCSYGPDETLAKAP